MVFDNVSATVAPDGQSAPPDRREPRRAAQPETDGYQLKLEAELRRLARRAARLTAD
jgi:hypothetical protein